MKANRATQFHGLMIFTLIISLCSCKSGPVNLFKAASPHEAYRRKLINAGLDKTAMGTSWINTADQSLQKALNITLPFRETGYFAAEQTPAMAYLFTAVQGQKIYLTLNKNPAEQFMVYADLWEYSSNAPLKPVQSLDTLGTALQVEVKTTGTYLLRLQPELLRGGQYTLDISTGPSLGFPVKFTRANIGSYFGDGRDANSRKHEGVDIFEKFHTPVIAAAAGTVTRVNENNLGGLVVWMRPRGEDYTLYYAHLDRQIAVEGQEVNPGDTLGLMGNTGNAKTTAPHLHFGVYTNSGAVDPLPYINPTIHKAGKIEGTLANLNATLRTANVTALYKGEQQDAVKISSLKQGTIVHVNAASTSWYTVTLPNGQQGFIPVKQLTAIAKPLKKIKLTADQLNAFDRPDRTSAVIVNLKTGSLVEVLGVFEGYQLITLNDQQTGWVKI